MAGFTLYYVPLNDLNWTLMQENIKKIIPTVIYIYILSNMTNNNWFEYYVTVNLTLIQGKYLRKKKYMFLLMWQIKS
jgi:hypothetical protein